MGVLLGRNGLVWSQTLWAASGSNTEPRFPSTPSCPRITVPDG